MSLKSLSSISERKSLGVGLLRFFNISTFLRFISCLCPHLSQTYLWILSKVEHLPHYLYPRGSFFFYFYPFADLAIGFFLFALPINKQQLQLKANTTGQLFLNLIVVFNVIMVLLPLIQQLILLLSRMQKSASVSKLPSQASFNRQSSVKSISSSRLNFPQPGDSSIFKNAGRKHFENHSDRMLKIILPEKYAIQRPFMFRKENSLPPPHLIRHEDSQRIFQNRSILNNEDKVKAVPKQVSLRDKIEDQLDRMRKSIQKPKPRNISQTKNGEQAQKVVEVTPYSPVKQQKARISNLFSLTPSVSAKIQHGQQSPPRLLYNPQNKQRYDSLLMGRWKNPTNLSTGLSII